MARHTPTGWWPTLPTIVPVAKGNGYGFGLSMLGGRDGKARLRHVGGRNTRRGADGARRVRRRRPRPHAVAPGDRPGAGRRTTDSSSPLSSPEAVRALAGHRRRVVVELLTSMRRFGLDEEALARAVPDIRTSALSTASPCTCPIDDGELSRVEEISSWVSTLRRHQLPTDTLWVSHVTARRAGDAAPPSPRDDVPTADRHRAVARRAASRTRRAAPCSRATRIRRGSTRSATASGARRVTGHLLVVGGGTSHGVALSAPRAVSGVTRAR